MPLVQLVEHVGGVVGRHFRDDLGGLVRVKVFEDVDRHLLIKFGQRLGRLVSREMAQQATLFLQAQVLNVVRHVRRVRVIRIPVFHVFHAARQRLLADSFRVPGGLIRRRFLFEGRIRHRHLLLA